MRSEALKSSVEYTDACIKELLTGETKLAEQNCFLIDRGSNRRYLDFMYDLAVHAGWNQTIRDVERIALLSGDLNFLATVNAGGKSIPLATGSCIPLGEEAFWVGMILVDKRMRRQGIANAMMRHCLASAINTGRAVHGLDATAEGAAVYRALGYVSQYPVWRGKFAVSEFSVVYPQMEVVSISDGELVEAVLSYDTKSCFNRENVIRALLADAESESWAALSSSGEICGYTILRGGRLYRQLGPLVADDESCAKALITQVCRCLDHLGVAQVVMDVPGFHLSADMSGKHQFIDSFKPEREFLRMYQAVDEAKARELVEEFSRQRLVPGQSKEVHEFRQLLMRCVGNDKISREFMAKEAEAAAAKWWAITGPEKG